MTKVLEAPTLVLNRNWQPVNVASVARALVLVWNDSAKVVDPDDYRLYTWADWSQLAAAIGRSVHSGRSPAAAGAGGDRAGGLRQAAERRRQLQPPQYLQAGSLHLPVLRRPAGERRAVDRPCRSAFAGRPVELGELRAGVHRLQQAKGRPPAAASRHEAPQSARSAGLEADLCPPQCTHCKLVAVHERGVLECGTREVVSCTLRSAASASQLTTDNWQLTNHALRVCRNSTAVFETAGRRSIRRRGIET